MNLTPTRQAAKAASLASKIYSRLEALDFSNNAFGLQGTRLVAELINPRLTPHQFLRHLSLSKCGIPEGGGLELVHAMQGAEYHTLQVLDLSHNMLGNKTAVALGELLLDNTHLRELNLAWNAIKVRGRRGYTKFVKCGFVVCKPRKPLRHVARLAANATATTGSMP